MRIEGSSQLAWTTQVIEADELAGRTRSADDAPPRPMPRPPRASDPASVGSAPQQSFPLFTRLPDELRTHVWRHTSLGATAKALRTSRHDARLMQDPTIRAATRIALRNFVDTFSAHPQDLLESRGESAVLSALEQADQAQIDAVAERFHRVITDPDPPVRSTVSPWTAGHAAALLLASGKLSLERTISLLDALDDQPVPKHVAGTTLKRLNAAT